MLILLLNIFHGFNIVMEKLKLLIIIWIFLIFKSWNSKLTRPNDGTIFFSVNCLLLWIWFGRNTWACMIILKQFGRTRTWAIIWVERIRSCHKMSKALFSFGILSTYFIKWIHFIFWWLLHLFFPSYYIFRFFYFTPLIFYHVIFTLTRFITLTLKVSNPF